MAYESPVPARAIPGDMQALKYGAAMAAASLGALALALWPSDGAGSVVALYPPGWSRATAFAAAADAAESVSLGRAPFVVQAHSGRPGLAARLRQSGAWLVLNMNGADCGQTAGKTE
jgi:hypothetical protein